MWRNYSNKGYGRMECKYRYTRAVIGIHKVKGGPGRIAKFLKKKNPEQYKGHTYRRTAAGALVEQDISANKLLIFGAWKNMRTAQRYIDSSPSMAKKVVYIYI